MALADYRVKDVPPDMTEDAFVAAKRALSSPVSDDDARKVYRYCVERRFSPAALLAWFNHESGAGRNGWAATTKSFGNTRPPSFGAPHIGVYNQDTGTFYPATLPDDQRPKGRYLSAYDGWTNGGISTVARFFDHAPYAGKETVRALVPVWAPSNDGNNVENYIAKVLADIERWARPQERPMGLTIRDAFIPTGNSNRPGTKLQGGKPTFITVHETANPNAGANAEMHRRFTHGANGWGGGGHPATATEPEYEGVSFHYVVDDKEAVHLLPDNEIGYHAGDGLGPGSGGATSLGIETCVNSDGDFSKARANLSQLVAVLMQRHAIPLANVVQHNKWSGKDCPKKIRAGGLWAGQLAAIKAAYEALTRPVPPKRDEGTYTVTQTADGRTVLTIDFGGTATKTLGVALVDVGVTVENAKGEKHSRSVQGGVFGEWVKHE